MRKTTRHVTCSIQLGRVTHESAARGREHRGEALHAPAPAPAPAGTCASSATWRTQTRLARRGTSMATPARPRRTHGIVLPRQWSSHAVWCMPRAARCALHVAGMCTLHQATSVGTDASLVKLQRTRIIPLRRRCAQRTPLMQREPVQGAKHAWHATHTCHHDVHLAYTARLAHKKHAQTQART